MNIQRRPIAQYLLNTGVDRVIKDNPVPHGAMNLNVPADLLDGNRDLLNVQPVTFWSHLNAAPAIRHQRAPFKQPQRTWGAVPQASKSMPIKVKRLRIKGLEAARPDVWVPAEK